MHYYKRNLGDYAKKAGRLSMLQHGSYTLLIDACYDREQFPTLEEAIEWTWASTTEEIEAVTFVLRKFFTLENGVYVQNRIQEEIEEFHNKSETNKRIAIERETKRKENITNRTRNVDETIKKDNESPPNHKPLTNNHKPEEQTHTVENLTSVEPTLAASVCLELKKLNYIDINPSHPKLLAMLNAGATLDEFVNAAKTVKVKKFVYVIGAVEGMRKEAAAANVTIGNFEEATKARAWRTSETLMVAKAKELGIGTGGLGKFELIAKIDAKIESMKARA